MNHGKDMVMLLVGGKAKFLVKTAFKSKKSISQIEQSAEDFANVIKKGHLQLLFNF